MTGAPHLTGDMDLRMDLQRACARLTERQRAVLALTLDGYTQREVGEMLRVSHVAVHYHLAAARRILEQSLN